ncbi:Hypothetical Protein RradSPS_2506 [Rubrobacter radiotolerans]|uniref:Uncharacterized protein n=1 Tax=Rubrobacter radiotolerans TaxID=42256 RepID=A0A023X6U3_RUBRA|nr:Hypothetical Protein RradSPS_2506 [Rubrobacter radiotolerans]SMC07719.1 hypothetical protein SAMN00767673_2579 [Rubrobacter radiotolerans DSM 5868]
MDISPETARRAWGDVPEGVRRRIVLAALLFSRRFEAAVSEGALPDARDAQRFLMRLMGDVIDDFARLEGIPSEEATRFLGDVDNRDRILELNEVLDLYGLPENEKTLDALLLESVEDRPRRAAWADHWTSG